MCASGWELRSRWHASCSHTDGLDLFVRKYGELINVSKGGQRALREVVEAYLRRIERDEAGLAARLFPFSRLALDAPRLVVIDPARGFGRPILAGAGISTAVVAERFKAGESRDRAGVRLRLFCRRGR